MALQEKLDYFLDNQKCSIGYPMNFSYDYTPLVKEYLNLFACKFNNIGPVDKPSVYTSHTKDFDKKVIDFLASLWKFDLEHVWGYITANGTEGNTQALYIARQLYPTGILYFSTETHYSIRKIAKLLCMTTVEIPSSEKGEMDYIAFEKGLLENLDKPVIVCANIGTTMKGAIDDTREIYRIIRKHHKHNDYFLHADGALSGFLLPFFEKDLFFKRYIHSIAISCHKFLGIPFPCGVILLDTKHCARMKQTIDNSAYVEYIDCNDCTISGSRSGHASIFINYAFETFGLKRFEADTAQCIENANYLVEKLNDIESVEMNAWRNNNSIIVILTRPKEEVVKKWQLACEKGVSHVVVMPHVTKKLIDEFVSDVTTG